MVAYTYVTTFDQCVDAVGRILCDVAQDPRVAGDTETYQAIQIQQPYGFRDPHTHKVRLLQVKTALSDPIIFDVRALSQWPAAIELLQELITCPDIVWLFHNAKFDIKMLYGTLGVWLEQVWDSMIAAYLIGYATGISATRQRGLRLTDLTRDYLGIPLDKTEQQSDWGVLQLRPEQLEYAALDVVYLHALHDILHTALVEEYQSPQTEQLEMDILTYVAEIEWNGMGFNKKLFEFIQLCAKRQLPQLSYDLGKHFGVPMQQDLDDDLEVIEIPRINWDSGPQVLRLLRAHGYEIDDLEYETLEPISRDDPWIKKLLDYKAIAKQLQTPLGSWVHPLTGRIHGECDTQGAATGRCAASHPNLQQISKIQVEIPVDLLPLCPVDPQRFWKKKKEKHLVAYRDCFVPEDGNHFYSADYFSQEVGIMACESDDAGMLEVLRKPQFLTSADGAYVLNDKGEPVENPEADMHSINCEKAFGASHGVTKDRSREPHPDILGKTFRDLTKQVTFGAAYGQTEAGFARGWGVAVDIAKRIRASILNAMPGLVRWMKKIGRIGKTTKLIRFGLDRLRFLNDLRHTDPGAVERAAGNTPIQGTGSQMIKLAILYLGRRFRRLNRELMRRVYILMYPVHDEITSEAPIPLHAGTEAMIKEEMNRSSDVFLQGKIPSRASCAAGDHWDH